MPKLIISMGMKYNDTPDDGPVIDVRRLFNRNPFRRKDLRKLRGTDPAVQEDIRQTPGFLDSYQLLYERVRGLSDDIVYLACTGGHHRSVYLAEQIAHDFRCDVIHRDINKS